MSTYSFPINLYVLINYLLVVVAERNFVTSVVNLGRVVDVPSGMSTGFLNALQRSLFLTRIDHSRRESHSTVHIKAMGENGDGYSSGVVTLGLVICPMCGCIWCRSNFLQYYRTYASWPRIIRSLRNYDLMKKNHRPSVTPASTSVSTSRQ